jgi:tetratricopeptide (TPR) repeat protein
MNLYNKPFFKACLFLFAILLQALFVLAQPPATKGNVVIKKEDPKSKGNTYALITGISRYQANDSYQNLQYADADAMEFYRYLVSGKGGKLSSANVDTLFNENASFMEFWRKFNRIKEKLQKNDVFYIYFSGHGDAYRADEAYLLAYDAPAGNDRNNYSTGVGLIDIHKLKVRIQEITGNGTQVILITDACRTNELPGKGEGLTISYQQIFERKAGEVQLISCASNQVSFEGSQWGGGRGLFSWHLINGLRGMADTDPEDGEVTLTELYDYVKKNVNKASYDAATKKYRQTPQYCCNDNDAFVVSKVDAGEKEKLIAMLQSGVSYSPDKADFAVNKSVHLGSAMKEAGMDDLYRQFLKALNEGRLIETGGANDILNEILRRKETNKELADELKFTLSSKLMTDVTKVINIYLHAGTNNNNYTYDFFMNAAKKLRLFQQIADTNYYNPLDVKVNLLFLEGHSKWLSYNTDDLRYSLSKVDSAIQLKPQAAYLYNLKGLMHIALNQLEQGKTALKTGIVLAPNWLYPYHNMGSALTHQFKFDSAMIYYQKALVLDSNYQTSYGGISNLYSSKNNIDSAIIWTKNGLKKDITDAQLWTQLGNAYYQKKQWKEAMAAYQNGIHYNPMYLYAQEGALRVHLYDFKSNDSVNYYVNKMIATDSMSPAVYQSLGAIYTEFGWYKEALNMLDYSISIDSLNPETWKIAGNTYQAMGKDTFAINAYAMAWKIDSTDVGTNNQLGNLFFKLQDYETAKHLFGKAIETDPGNSTLLSNYGMAAQYNKETVLAESFYKKALIKDKKNAGAYFQLATLYAPDKPADALINLKKAIEFGYTKAEIEAEPMLLVLKDYEGFKLFMEKLK